MADEYNNAYGQRAAQMGAFVRDRLPEFNGRFGTLQNSWDALQRSVDAAKGSTEAAQATSRAYNALLTAMKQSGATLGDDVGGVVTAYARVLEQIFKVKVVDDDRCDAVSCDPPSAPTAPSSDVVAAQALALKSAPPEYWWQAYFRRSSDGTYRRRTQGAYDVATDVPDNFWPGHGPTSDDALNSAGPNAVYTPAIHAGMEDLVSDIADSDAAVGALEATVRTIKAKIKLAESTLDEIARVKRSTIDALLSRPDDNFRFNSPSVDWLSHDAQLRVRLAA